jgi:hypothetical protein
MHAGILGIYRVEVAIARKVGVSHVALDAQFLGQADQHFDISEVEAALEEGRKQQLNGFVLSAQRMRKADKAMRIRRIWGPLNFVEGEVDPFTFSRVAQRFGDPVVLMAATEFTFQVLAPVDALGRQIRVQKERAVPDFRLQMWTQFQGPVEATLSDKTPGTNGVKNNINTHGYFSVLSRRSAQGPL